MKRKIIFFIVLLCLSLTIKAQITISDENFEQALIDLKWDTDGLNGSITEADAAKIDTLRIWNADNLDLDGKGIPYNPHLQNVKGKITNISAVKYMPNLVYLNASYNEIEEIDIYSNTNLTYLDISENRISEIDTKLNKELKVLLVYKNLLAELTTNFNEKLEQVSFGENLIESIDFSKNKNLKKVSCVNSEIEQLSLTNNNLLSRLEFFNNSKVTTLNLSKNPNIDTLYVSGNQNLSSINLKNGGNTKIEISGFLMIDNPKLACVDVDDPSYSDSNWFIKDANLEFRENCKGSDYVYIPDNALKKAINNGGISTIDDDYVLKSSLDELTTLNISGNIADITGLEEITGIKDLQITESENAQVFIEKQADLKYLSIQSLHSENNPVMEILNLNSNLKLETLNASGLNKLQSIVISSDAPLKELYCYGNKELKSLSFPKSTLTTLDVSSNRNLLSLNISDAPLLKNLNVRYTSKLTTLDLNNCVEIESLDIFDSGIENLNVTGMIALKSLSSGTINTPALESISFGNNPLLNSIIISNSKLSDIDLSSLSELQTLRITSSDLDVINVSNNIKLSSINFSGNKLSNIEIASLPSLETLILKNNTISSIDVNSNENLKSLDVSNNTLSSLDISSNLELLSIDISDNQIANFIVSDNQSLTSLNISGNPDLVVDISLNNVLESFDCSNTNLSSLAIENNAALKTLVASNNNLSILNVSANINLENLNINDNTIGEIDLSKNTLLSSFEADNNSLFELNTSLNTNLISLSLLNNNINTLDLSNNVLLEQLNVSENNFDILDVSKLSQLYRLNIENNNITELAISALPSLLYLHAKNNLITELDFQNNPLIHHIDVNNNKLIKVNLNIGLNTRSRYSSKFSLPSALGFLDLRNNATLTCVQVDDVTYAKDEWENIDDNTVYNEDCGYVKTEFVKIDDSNFERKLVSYGFDTNGLSGNIKLQDAEAIDSLKLANSLIENLKGLDRMINVEYIDISENYIYDVNIPEELSKLTYLNLSNAFRKPLYRNTEPQTKITLSNLPLLKTLKLSGNSFLSIDITKVTELDSLFVNNNRLTSLKIGNNTKLKYLNASTNNIFELDVSNNKDLEQLLIRENKISEIDTKDLPKLKIFNISATDIESIDVSKNIQLIDLNISENNISKLDIDNNEILEFLDISDAKIDTLSIFKNENLTKLNANGNNLSKLNVSRNTLLEELVLSNNKIINIDISQNVNLKKLLLNNNAIERANLKNGNNTAILEFDITNNEKLTCIAVDDIDFSTTNWTNKDANSNYNTDCLAEWEVYVEDENLSIALDEVDGLDKDGDGSITYEEAQAFIGDLDLSGKDIISVDAIAAFKNAASINISGNSIIDISSLLNSAGVILSSKITGEKRFVSTNGGGIKVLNVANNLIEEVDISKVLTLVELNLANNRLTSLDLRNGNNTILEKLDVTNNPNLKCISVDNVAEATGKTQWFKDATAFYSTNCKSALGLEDFLKENISIYPNPVESTLSVSLYNNVEFEKLEIYNVLGKRVLSSSTHSVNLESLSKGLYLAKVHTNMGILNHKFLKR